MADCQSGLIRRWTRPLEGVQAARRAHVKRPIHDGRGRKNLLTEIIPRQHLQLVAGPQDQDDAFLRRQEDFLTGGHGRRISPR